MIYRDEDLVLPFKRAGQSDPYRLPLWLKEYQKAHPIIVMDCEHQTLPLNAIQDMPPTTMLEAYSRYPAAATLQEILLCMQEEDICQFVTEDSENIRQGILKIIGESNESGMAIESFVKAKLTELMIEMMAAPETPSAEEFINLFRHASTLTLNREINAEKVLSSFDVLDEQDCSTQIFADVFADPTINDDLREQILQAIHSGHAQKWGFQPAQVFIVDLKEHGFLTASGVALKRPTGNYILIDREVAHSFPNCAGVLLHEGTHIYQYNLIDVVKNLQALRADYKPSGDSADREAEFMNSMRNLFPYQEGSLFYEVIHNDDLLNYARICALGHIYYKGVDSDVPLAKEAQYLDNPLEVLAFAVGDNVEKYLRTTDPDERQVMRDNLQKAADIKKDISQARESLFHYIFAFDLRQPA